MKQKEISRREILKVTGAAGAGLVLGVGPLVGRGSRQSPLIQRPIPSTGEKVPIVGIGTARRYSVGTSSEERAPLKEVLKNFADMGGKVVDTAPSYGTFKKLRTEKIDLIQVHNLVGLDLMLPVLLEMKKEGRIRYVGVSTSRNRQYPDFIKMMKKEDIDFIQVNYSLASRTSAETILPLARDRGMAVLVNVPFGRGRLFGRVGDRSLPDWASEADINSWGQFFLKYVLSHPAVTCVIPGTAKMSYLTDNMGAAQGKMPDRGMRQRMEKFFDDLPS
jgi:aryl-alcohol dehydrogenase-like predicted oxidoreductase